MVQTVMQGQSRVLFSRAFIPDWNHSGTDCQTGDNGGISGHEAKTKRREQEQAVADEVQSEYSFRMATSGRSYELEMQILLTEGTLPEFEIGYFRLSPSGATATKEEKIVVWLAALNTAFSFVCDVNENRLLAESVLKLLIKYLQDYCRAVSEPNLVLAKPDRVALIVDQFLPKGKLLFMNHRVVRQFEKELEIKMKSQA